MRFQCSVVDTGVVDAMNVDSEVATALFNVNPSFYCTGLYHGMTKNAYQFGCVDQKGCEIPFLAKFFWYIS